MAEVNVNKPSSEQKGGGQGSGEKGGLARRMESMPSMFMLNPREFFRMSPFELMRRFTQEMDRNWGLTQEPAASMWTPAVEVTEREGNMVVRAELPGLNKEDVKIEASDDGLVIQGERKREHQEEREGYYRSERSYGQFYRLIPLPEGANVEQARAQFNNGVLEVTVPVPAQQSRRREIPIQAQPAEKTRTSGGGTT